MHRPGARLLTQILVFVFAELWPCSPRPCLVRIRSGKFAVRLARLVQASQERMADVCMGLEICQGVNNKMAQALFK